MYQGIPAIKSCRANDIMIMITCRYMNFFDEKLNNTGCFKKIVNGSGINYFNILWSWRPEILHK